MPVRKSVRRPEYEAALQTIAQSFPRAPEIARGAEWSITRNPDGDGRYDPQLDVWYATIMGAPGVDFPPHFIIYAFNEAEVRFLTITPAT